MKRAYKIFWILLLVLIPIFPLSGITYGVDISDVGFSLNQYYFGPGDIGTVCLPILLSAMMGSVWLKICGVFAIPDYFGMEIAWILALYYMCFLSYRIYKKYRDDSLILPALVLAELFAKCNFHYFIYTTAVAVVALTALYFLILGLNEKKPLHLAVSVFFVMMATLCKVSSLMLLATFVVLFYDFYRKRDARYFWKQILYCVLGFVAGIVVALILIQATCGIGAYADKFVEMFLYAGTSKDGHTLGDMVMSNLKGAMRGAVLLALLYVVSLIPKKIAGLKKVFQYGVPAVLVLLVVGKFVGLSRVPGFSTLYGMATDYFNALTVAVALIYIVTVLVLRDKSYSEEFKYLVLSSAIMTLLLPIGSNTGIYHVCNEIFFVMPFIVIYIGDRLRSSERFSTGTVLAWATIVWCVCLTTYQSLYLTRAYYAAEKAGQVKQFTIEELRFMSYEETEVDELSGVTQFLKQYAGGERKLLVAGAAPLLNYLSGIAPFNTGCGGWIQTEHITRETVEEELADATVKPIVVFCETHVGENMEKPELVRAYVDENDYELVYENDEYSVYVPVE